MISNLAAENTFFYSADISGIDNRSKALFETRVLQLVSKSDPACPGKDKIYQVSRIFYAYLHAYTKEITCTEVYGGKVDRC